MTAIAILLVIVLGGGASVAAQNAEPTSKLLHTIKLEVNERFEAALAPSLESKIEKEISFATARLKEAEEAAVAGQLDADIRARLEANFAAHADRVKARIAELQARGETEKAAHLASVFEASLNAHENILARLTEAALSGEIESRAELRAVLEKVNMRVEKAVEIREKAELRVESGTDVKVAAEGKMQAATNKIAEVEKFIADHEAKLGADAVASAKVQLQTAKTTFADGQAKFAAGAYGEAFALFQKSMREAQEAKLMAQAHADLQIEIRVRGEVKNESHDQGSANENERGRSEIKIENQVDSREKIELELR